MLNNKCISPELQIQFTILDDNEHVAFHLPSTQALSLALAEQSLMRAYATQEYLQKLAVSLKQRKRQAVLKKKEEIDAVPSMDDNGEGPSIEQQLLQNVKQIEALSKSVERQRSLAMRKGQSHNSCHASNIMGSDFGLISAEHQMPRVERDKSEEEYWEKGGDWERQMIQSAKTVLSDMKILTPAGQMLMHGFDTRVDEEQDVSNDEEQRQKEQIVVDLLQYGGLDMEETHPSQMEHNGCQVTHNCALYIALDISGSMNSNADFEVALVGIERFLAQFMVLFRNCKLFPFHGGCSPRQLNMGNFSRILRSTLRDGQTNYINVLNAIAVSISQEDPQRDIVVWFLSDGLYTDCDDEFFKCTDRLKSSFESIRAMRTITFHTIGFGNPLLEPLLNISNLGNQRGTYQFAETMALFATRAMMGDIVETTIVQNRATQNAYAIAYVSDEAPGRREYIRFTEEITIMKLTEKMRRCLFDTKPQQTMKGSPPLVAFTDAGDFLQHKLNLVHFDDAYTKLMCSINFVESKLMAIMDRLTVSRRSSFLHPIKIENAEIEVVELDNRLTDLFNDPQFSRLRGEAKATVGDRIRYGKELITNLFQVLRHDAKANKGASDGHCAFSARSDGLAKLLSSCYVGLTRRRLAKKLSKRILQNRNLLDDLELELRRVRRTISVEQLAFSSSQASREFFQCSFSLNNWIESLREGSAIFLGINISRSQAAVADPSQVKIHQIATTMVSSNDFLRSTALALRDDAIRTKENKRSGEHVHGGFTRTRKQGSVVKGSSREEINGAIPLFIHPEHWKIARLASRPILAWMATTDVFGFHPLQSSQLPLMCLFKLMDLWDAPATEFHGRVFFQLVRTCIQIIDENKIRVLDYEQPINRLQDSNPSNRILLVRLLLDPKRFEIRRLVLQILEEEIRRAMRAKYSSDDRIMDRIARRLRSDKLVSLNDSKFSPAELHSMPLETRYQFRIYSHEDAGSLEKMVNRQIGKSLAILCRFVQLYTLFEGIQMDAFAAELDINGGIAHDGLVKKYCNLMSANRGKETASLQELIKTLNSLPIQVTPGCEERTVSPVSFTKEQVNALVVQCALHRRNAERRRAIQDLGSSLLQPLFSEDDALKVLNKFVQGCYQTQIAHVVATCRAAYNLVHKLRESLNPFCEMIFRQRTAMEVEGVLMKGMYNGQPVDINSPHSLADSPLTIALATRRWDLLELLLRFGADPCRMLFKGRNAMFYAVRAFRKAAGTMPAGPLLDFLEANPNCIFCDTNRERPLVVLLTELDLTEELMQVQERHIIATKKRLQIVGGIRDALHKYERTRVEREALKESQREIEVHARLKAAAHYSKGRIITNR